MIRKVLVATDFSETSDGALRWGAEIARAHDARGLERVALAARALLGGRAIT